MNDAVKLESEESVEPQTLEESSALDYEGWLEAILAVARHHRLDCSAQNVRIAAQWSKDVNVDEVLRQMARQAGLTLKIVDFTPSLLVQRRLPLVLQFSDGQIGVLQALNDDDELGIVYSGDQGLQSRISRA